MLPTEAARATERYFRELPRTIHRVCDDWARRTSNVFRRLSTLPGEVRKTIGGKAIRYGGESFAQVTCESPLGLWIERGTGIYGPFKRPIRAKGGAYTDAKGRLRKRRMLRWKGTVYQAAGVRGKWMATGDGGGGQYAELYGGATYRASAGYIFAYEVKGSPARPWFVRGVEARIPMFENCLRTNMALCTDAIRNGGAPMRGIVPSG
jgi:hypothetical protein